MARMNLLLGADVLVDFLEEREGFEEARLLLAMGIVKEATLWVPAHQLLAVAQEVSAGKKKKAAAAMAKLRKLEQVVNVAAVGQAQVAAVLASAADPEVALLDALAKELKAEALITGTKPETEVPAFSAAEFFACLKNEKGVDYHAIAAQ